MERDVEVTVGVSDAVEADRDIRQLSERNNRLSGLFFIIAAVVGALFLLISFLFGGDDPVEDLETRVQTTQPTNEPIVLPEPVTVVTPQVTEQPNSNDARLAALEYERLRQQALARERANELAAERRAEFLEQQRKRRESEMVVVDRSDGSNEAIDSEDAIMERQLDALNALAQNSGGGGGGFGGFDEGFVDPEDNQVLADANERFLRDASNTEVVEASAVVLENQNFLITQGTILSGVLETAINSDLPGMTRALVDRPVYSRTGSQVLIPRGSRLIGRYASGADTGQSRVYIVWSRLERPDGVVIELGSPGTDTLGRAGLGGDVDRHFFERFGAAALLTAIGPTIGLLADSSNNSQFQNQILRDSQRDAEDAVKTVLDDSLRIPPTITVDQGTEIAIFVNRDLSFAEAMGGK